MNEFNPQDILQEWQNTDLKLLPTFAIIGAMKSGTTSLYHYMNEHPDIYFPEIKEPGIFLSFAQHKKKMATNDVHIESRQHAIEYLMQDYQGQSHIGEASIFYTKAPTQGMDSPLRIKLLQPSIKLIYLLRNPLDRIISHYQHNCIYFKHVKKSEFNHYLAVNSQILLATSLYFYQLSHFLKQFTLDSFLIITTEELELHPEQTLKQVFEFLDIDSQFQCKSLAVKHHTSGKHLDIEKPKFDRQTYQQVMKMISQDVQKMELFLGKKLNWDFSEQNYT
ncbi:sulfotransferase domain-containing protein [Candidatus Albibeggiatoa sp. nov. BB20]|uniref:sulfotransferase domain-containing protein n=1 Tax=Candidatus Albibeggiatoa sp. nov. BB20 TaxID=3162723 RepID=UPI00336593EA